jgi:hypothetical protein
MIHCQHYSCEGRRFPFLLYLVQTFFNASSSNLIMHNQLPIAGKFYQEE